MTACKYIYTVYVKNFSASINYSLWKYHEWIYNKLWCFVKHSTPEYVEHMLCSAQIITRTHSQNELRLGLRLIFLFQNNFNEPLQRVCKLPVPLNCPICKEMLSRKFELTRNDKPIVLFHNSVAAFMHIAILIVTKQKKQGKQTKSLNSSTYREQIEQILSIDLCANTCCAKEHT